MTMKKKLLTTLSVVLILGLAALGILAYLTDTDSDVNVMTLGNVDIEQIEQERDADGNLVDFTQAKPLYPAVYPGTSTSDSINYADSSEWVFESDAWKVVQANENVLDKFVTVKNTGKSDAYVRTLIAFEGDVINGTDIHVLVNGKDQGITQEFINNVTIDGVRYDVIVFTYNTALESGETSVPSLRQVYMDHTCTNEDVAKYGDTYDILVLSQAVQADGFEDAQTALNTAFGKATDNAAAWFEGDEFAIPTVVATAADMKAALLAKDEVVVLADDITVTTEDRYSDYHGFYVYTTLDGNGKVVNDETASVYGGIVAKESNSLKNFTYNTNSTYGIFALKNTNLIISDLTMNKSSVGSAVYCDKESTVTLNNVIVTAPGTATGGNANAVVFSTVNTNVIINSGVYTATAENGIAIAAHNNATLTVNGGTFVGTIVEANGGDVIIKGGTFSVNPSDFVAAGYTVTQNADNTWTVK